MKRNSLLALFLTLVILAGSCKKENQVGNDIQPPNLSLITTDTVTVIAETLPGDSFPSRNLTSNYLGLINDPLYGKTRYSIFSQFIPPLPTTLVDATTDSVILYLTYKGVYGDRSLPLNIQVYQLSSDLPASTAHSDFSETGMIDNTLLADHVFNPSLPSNLAVLGDTINALRIPLDPSILGNKFISATSADLSSQAAWVNYFKGLFIKTVDQNLTGLKGSALNYDLANSMIVFYYKNNGQSSTLKLSAADGTKVAQVIQNPAGSRAAASTGIENADTLYISGHGGQKIRITFPYISELKKLNPRGTSITVNKAELKFTQLLSGSSLYVESKEVSAYALNANGSTGSLVNSGSRNSSNAYSLSMHTHIQEAINGTKEKGLILRLSGDDVSAQRMMIPGKNNIKLVLTLTKL